MEKPAFSPASRLKRSALSTPLERRTNICYSIITSDRKRNVLLGCVRAEVVYRLFARATPPPAVGFGNMTMERVTVTVGATARSSSSILWRRMDSLNLLHVTEKITDLTACLPACLQPLILQMVRYSRYCMAYSFNNQACLPVGVNEIISTRVLSPVHDPRMR